jgi:hypothetical protein
MSIDLILDLFRRKIGFSPSDPQFEDYQDNQVVPAI